MSSKTVAYSDKPARSNNNFTASIFFSGKNGLGISALWDKISGRVVYPGGPQCAAPIKCTRVAYNFRTKGGPGLDQSAGALGARALIRASFEGPRRYVGFKIIIDQSEGPISLMIWF